MSLHLQARRPSGFNEGWATMRRELSTLYLRFYGCFVAGFFLLYQVWCFHSCAVCALWRRRCFGQPCIRCNVQIQTYSTYFVFFTYSFWIPQVTMPAAGLAATF